MISECVGAGASNVIVATRPNDVVVPAYLDLLRSDGVPVEAVMEDLAYGNGTPLLTLRNRLYMEKSFGVAFGDDVLLGGHDLASMRELVDKGVEAVIATQRVDHAEISAFGVVDTHPNDTDRVIGIWQRPDPASVAEPLAVVSRLILRPSIFDLLVPSEYARGEVDLGVAVGEPRRYHDALQTYWRLQTEADTHD